jgi:hypothetical protein
MHSYLLPSSPSCSLPIPFMCDSYSMVIFLAADPLTRLTMEMVSHTLCADQTQQLRIDFQVN